MLPSVPKTALLLLIITILQQSQSTYAEGDGIRPWHCARCLYKSMKCSSTLARNCGGVCQSRTGTSSRPSGCKKLVCHWCLKGGKFTQACLPSSIKSMCGLPDVKLPKPPTTDPVKPLPPGIKSMCTWIGSGNSVVVDLGKVHPAKGWSRVSRGRNVGIVYEKSKKHGIEPPGLYGNMCFSVRVKEAGSYYFGAVSYAPHHTENNDVWVQGSKGFSIWQQGRLWKSGSSKEWFKAYQNYGCRGIAEDFKTKDHDGHRFIVENVKAWERFQVCISGRSYLFQIYRLVLVKCSGMTCKGSIIHGIKDLKPSKCI